MQSHDQENEATSGNVSSTPGELERASRRKVKRLASASTLRDHYGSLDKSSVEGKLFELDTFSLILKKQALYYFAFVVTCCLTWPILWVFIPVLVGIQKDSKMIKMFLILSVISVVTGVVFYLVPAIFVFRGGTDHVLRLMRANELSALDFSSCLTDQVLLLLAVVFSWIFHELTLDLSHIKELQLEQMRGVHFGGVVVLEQDQFENVVEASNRTAAGAKSEMLRNIHSRLGESETTSPRLNPQLSTSAGAQASLEQATFERHGSAAVPLFKVMCILEELVPGWRSGADGVNDYVSEVTGIPLRFKDMLQSASPRAYSKGLTSLDVFLTREQWLMHEQLTVLNGIKIVFLQTKDWFALSRSAIEMYPNWRILVIALTIVRTAVPRLWLKFGLGGALVPTDMAAMGVVIYSSVLTFSTTLFWMYLFITVLLEYRRNVAQVTILGAMVDPRLRVRYVEKYLMNPNEFDYNAEQAEEVLGALPVLSLKHSTNVAAFWNLRNFVQLDRSNERVAMSIFLEMLILWLVIKFVVTVVLTAALHKLTPFLVVTLFDVIVFGVLLVYSLSLALDINFLTNYHKRIIAETRQRLMLETAEADFDYKGKDVGDYAQNLRDTRRLLAESEEIIKECDHSDRILLDMDVTPGKVISVFASLCGAIYTLVTQMIKSGDVEHPGMLKENLLQLALAHRPFEHYMSHNPWSTWSTITSGGVPMQLQNWGTVIH